MSALAKMAIDMILKEVPPEARQMINNALTPESLDKVSNSLLGLLSFIGNDLPALREDIQLIRGGIERIEGKLNNDDNSGDGTGDGSSRIDPGSFGVDGDPA